MARQTLLIDADDTLWENNIFFEQMIETFLARLDPLGFSREYTRHILNETERRHVTVEDKALYIFTSGTTGLPKAANVSHARLMQWSYWFAGMLDARPTDRLYDCLPMYHSVGGVLAPGAILAEGGSLMPRKGGG